MVALAAAVVVVAVVVGVVAVVAVAAEVETEGVGGRGIGSMLVVVVMSRCVWSPLALSRRILGGFVTVSVAAAVVVVAEEEEVSVVAAGVGVVGLGLVGLSGSLDWVICLGGGDVALSGLDPALLSGLTGRLASLDCLFTTGFSS